MVKVIKTKISSLEEKYEQAAAEGACATLKKIEAHMEEIENPTRDRDMQDRIAGFEPNSDDLPLVVTTLLRTLTYDWRHYEQKVIVMFRIHQWSCLTYLFCVL